MRESLATARGVRYNADAPQLDRQRRVERTVMDGQHEKRHRYRSPYECHATQRCQRGLRSVETLRILDDIDRLLPRIDQTMDELRTRFDELADHWKRDTLIMSSSSQIYTHWAFRQIVELGEKALPFVVAELRQTLDVHWVQALSEISGFRYTKDGATPGDVTQAWLKWGSGRGYVS